LKKWSKLKILDIQKTNLYIEPKVPSEEKKEIEPRPKVPFEIKN